MCVRARARACVHARASACMRVRVRACVHGVFAIYDNSISPRLLMIIINIIIYI